jgi:hypothetical protein
LRSLNVEASRFIRYIDNLPLHPRRHDAVDPDAPVRFPEEVESIQESNRLRGNVKRVGGPRRKDLELSKIRNAEGYPDQLFPPVEAGPANTAYADPGVH